MDTGSLLTVPRESVRELPSGLLDTPSQAVLCSLADVNPVEEQWGEAADTAFTGTFFLHLF